MLNVIVLVFSFYKGLTSESVFYLHKTLTQVRVSFTPLLSPVPSPGYLAGDWWVESWCLSYILPHRFSVRDESHRISRPFILGGIPKDTSIIFQREPNQSYLFTAFSTSLKSRIRGSLPSSPAPLCCFTFTGHSIKSSILCSL